MVSHASAVGQTIARAAVTETAARAIVERLLATGIVWERLKFSELETTEITNFINLWLLPEFIGKGVGDFDSTEVVIADSNSILRDTLEGKR